MTQFFTILMFIAMFLVLVSLGVGLFAMVRGGDFNKKHSNKLMRLRVTLQGAALVFFVLAVWANNS